MTAFHHYELLCDADGCEATFNVGEARVTETRKQATAAGWVHVFRPGGYGRGRTKFNADYCPKHAEKASD